MYICDECGARFYDIEHKLAHVCSDEDKLRKARKELEEAHVSESGALRYNNNKLPMHLVPPDAIESMARVLDYGASKYSERNWELEAPVSVPYASLMRHLQAYWAGENCDPESNLSHLDHIIMNAAMLVRYAKNEENDDRPTKVVDKLKKR